MWKLRLVVPCLSCFSRLNTPTENESMPTVRCSTCSDPHHWPCVGFFDIEQYKFVCGLCKARKRRQGQELRQLETQARLQTLYAHPSLPIPIWHGPLPTYYRRSNVSVEAGGPYRIPFHSYTDPFYPGLPFHVEEPPPSPGSLNWVSQMALVAT